jgi:hypothetical protein
VRAPRADDVEAAGSRRARGAGGALRTSSTGTFASRTHVLGVAAHERPRRRPAASVRAEHDHVRADLARLAQDRVRDRLPHRLDEQRLALDAAGSCERHRLSRPWRVLFAHAHRT